MSTPVELSAGHPPQLQPSHHKPQRVLACVLCQQRKIRCDRTFPCANCQKQNARCVPATQTRPRRKRFPERELLNRLRRYEALLRENKVKFDPLHKQELTDGDGPADADHGTGDDSGDEPDKGGHASPSASLKSENVTEARSIWQAISQESPLNQGKDTPIANAIESSVKSAWDQLMDGDNILLGMNRNPVDLSTFHPDPVTAFKMWQLYLDNVDPLMKVTHTPTLQPRFIAALGNVGAIKPALEALMFSIYTISITSIQSDMCEEMFGMDRDDLLTKYQFGCQQALMNAGYQRSSDRECLTAMMYYLMSLRPGTNPRTLTVMLGVTVRLAQCLGIHRESMLAKCTPFEAEMRRRLWWCLMLYDSRMGEKADHKDPVLAPTWDCKLPLNCNDSDLWPDMKEPPQPSRTRVTEALFVVVRSELADHMRNSSWFLDFSNPCLKPLARELPDGGDLDALWERIEREYLRTCDYANKLHFFTYHMAKNYYFRSRLFEHFAMVLNTNGQQSEEQRDSGLEKALDYLDNDTLLGSSSLCQCFLWNMQSYFPFPAYMHVIQDLRRRPLAKLADRAWDVMARNYQARFRAFFHHTKDIRKLITPLSIMFSRTVLTAWEALQKASPDPTSLQVPEIVTEIMRRHMAVMPTGSGPQAGAFTDPHGANYALSAYASSEPSPTNSLSYAADSGPDGFVMNLEAIPYPSMVASESLVYDATQLDWFLQP